MIEPEHSPVLSPGTYRIQELSEKLGVARTTAERYIERFSIPTAEIHFQNKKVKALILDEASIVKILSQTDTSSIGTSENRSSQSSEKPPEQTSRVSVLKQEKNILEKDLQAAHQRIEDLKALLDERERLIIAKDSEVSTLKTALMIVERNNHEKTIELVPKQSIGLIGKMRQLKQWLTT